ncbi:FG-GAP repeat domain-containing protein [Rubinisphaera italica]|uniref:FG-GAP repeat protein n=1 Tax=Rubinisphaera italica TaxID=2527969 RepID=A0A5C5XBY0_9PLAN|nr:VCBS repeat-containing protein [Rubinisphaera italica]TWT60536.1 FG-GAP repeat protein [Rubinisphaera italica]
MPYLQLIHYSMLSLVLCPIVLVLGCGGSDSNDQPSSSTDSQFESDTLAEETVTFRCSEALEQLKIIYNNGEEAEQFSIVESLGGGVGVFDYDRDGWLDLIFPGGGTFSESTLEGLPTRILRQSAPEQFTDVSYAAGTEVVRHYTHGIANGDYNNDGFTDVLITGYGGLQLLSNNGDGSFSDVTDQVGLHDSSWSASAAWGDFNNDGFLDIYITHYVNWSIENNPICFNQDGHRDVCAPPDFSGLDDVIYLNSGDGTFTANREALGLSPEGKGLGVLLADWDEDGDLDIYVANDTVPNFFYSNNGNATFTEKALISGLAIDDMANSNGSMGLAVIDLDRDHRADIFVTNYEEELSALYMNLGGSNFSYESRQAGLNRLGKLFVGFGCVAGDFDLDGDHDVVISNGHAVRYPTNGELKQEPLLLINNDGRLNRMNAVPSSYFGQTHRGRGLATGDINRDGQLDLVFANILEPAVLLFGEVQQPQNRLLVSLVGRKVNRDAIGARVCIKMKSSELVEWTTAGMGYLSSSPNELLFVIPEEEVIEEIEIMWPGGDVSSVSADYLDLTMNDQGFGHLRIVE